MKVCRLAFFLIGLLVGVVGWVAIFLNARSSFREKENKITSLEIQVDSLKKTLKFEMDTNDGEFEAMKKACSDAGKVAQELLDSCDGDSFKDKIDKILSIKSGQTYWERRAAKEAKKKGVER